MMDSTVETSLVKEKNEPMLENGSNEDDVIPNAIVIKNIPFAIKKEQLLDIIQEMDLPLPYAFNYHFDNGIFRGLAFANFSTPDDTSKVITQLNGREINGRKLKVEYKKMLPQAERERIEREKREKRGQLEEQHRSVSNLSLSSMDKTTNATPGSTVSLLNNQVFSPSLSSLSGFQNSNGGNQQPMVNQNTAGSIYNTQNAYQPGGSTMSGPNGIMQQSQQTAVTDRFYAPLPAASSTPLPPQQLDLNDPDTLEVYSQLLLFKDREKQYYELAYPVGISANHKRIINVLCSFLNLVEVYDPRFIIIRRKVLNQNDLQSHIMQNQSQSMQQGSGLGNQENNSSIMHPLQASSTGGSMNRSHSYTNLLQAHAATAAAAANSGLGVNTGNSNSSTPKITQLAQQIVANQQQVSTPQAQMASSSPVINMQSGSLYTNEQQQQSLLRQSSNLTPSSRIPSGYSSNQMYNNVNPLLRNNGISPPTGQIAMNMSTSHSNQRIPQGFPSSASQLQQQQSFNQLSNQPMVQQHTNESIHSNYSLQSLHDDLVNQQSNSSVLGNGASGNNPNNAADMIYRTLSQSRFDDGLEQGLNRSLSALDLTGKEQESTANEKGTGW